MAADPVAPRRRLSSAERREVILRVATEVFAIHGYDRASMREIATGARVTTPVLYDHFGSKTDLYRQVVQQHAATLIATWSQPPPSTASLESFFLEANRRFFGWIREHEPGWRILFLDQPYAREAIDINRQVRGRADAAMAQLVAGLPGVDVPGSVSREAAAQAIAAQVTGAGNALAAWWGDNPSVPVEAVVQLNHALVWRGLAGLLS